MKKALIIIVIILAVVSAIAILFATQATPGNVLNSVRADSLEIVDGAVTVPEKYTVIDAEAFAGKGEFSRVIILGETEIGARAFYGCPNLREVTIEKDCDIKSGAFADCPALRSVTVKTAGGACAEDAFDGHGGLVISCREGSEVLEVAKIRDISFEIID